MKRGATSHQRIDERQKAILLEEKQKAFVVWQKDLSGCNADKLFFVKSVKMHDSDIQPKLQYTCAWVSLCADINE